MTCLPFAALVLAAGTASRMGKLKQNLPFEGSTLLRHAIHQAIAAGFTKTFVVVGAKAQEVQTSIASEPIEIVHNPEWSSGMGGSIVAGVRQIQQEPDANYAGVAILAGDQPFVTAQHLREMARELSRHSVDVVAAEYSETIGIPAVFGRQMFGRLLQMAPAAGAKALLQNAAIRVFRFPLPEAAMDVDTPEDWSRLASVQKA